MHLADAFIQSDLLSGYTFLSVCVPWELNPQPFALLTQCSTTEPQEHMKRLVQNGWFNSNETWTVESLAHSIHSKTDSFTKWNTVLLCTVVKKTNSTFVLATSRTCVDMQKSIDTKSVRILLVATVYIMYIIIHYISSCLLPSLDLFFRWLFDIHFLDETDVKFQ